MKISSKTTRVVISVVMVMLLLAACVPVPQPTEELAAGVNVRTEKALVVSNYITDQGTLEVAGATTLAGALALNGAVTIGDGGDTVAVNSSDWDISTTGVMTGIGAITADGLITGQLGATVSGATTSINNDSNFGTNINTGTSSGALALGGGSGTVAVNSSDWDISTAGVMTGIGAITADGLITGQLGATISGATTAINNDSNFGTNINTGTSSGALALGGGSGTVAVNSSDWDISTAGVMTGIGAITADGLITGQLGATISGATTAINNDSNFGTNINTGSSSGALALGGGSGTVAVNSSDWDISTTGAMTGIGAITANGAWYTSSTIGATGAITGTSGATISGATTSINNDSNFGTNINTGSSSGALALGGGSGTVAVNSSDWDISTTGAMTGIGTITADGLITGTAGATVSGGDVTLSPDAGGGNAGAINQFIGVPRIKLVGLGLMADGTTNTVLTDIGDSETPATDWTKVSAGTSITVTNDSVRWRQGSASLKIVMDATAIAGEGITNSLASGDQDWTDDEALGMWIYADQALAAGDLVLRIADATAAGGYTDVNVPAVAASTWTWAECDVTLSNNNLKDVITDLSILLSAAGQVKAAAGTLSQVNLDFIVKWDVAVEEALGVDIQQDGVMSVLAVDGTNGSVTNTNLVEYTNYFVHYQASGDAIVPITDLDDADLFGMALVAH